MVHVCHNSPHSFQKVSNKFENICQTDFHPKNQFIFFSKNFFLPQFFLAISAAFTVDWHIELIRFCPLKHKLSLTTFIKIFIG